MGYEWVLLILVSRSDSTSIHDIPMESYRICEQAKRNIDSTMANSWGMWKTVCIPVKEPKKVEK